MSIERSDIFTFRFFDYGENFNGSYRGMRYRLGREPLKNVSFSSQEEKEEGSIRAFAWPEPLSFDNTDDEKKHQKDFPYSEEGVCSAVKWLNEEWENMKNG